MTIDFLEIDPTVNSASYCQFVWQNSPYLLNELGDYRQVWLNKIKSLLVWSFNFFSGKSPYVFFFLSYNLEIC